MKSNKKFKNTVRIAVAGLIMAPLLTFSSASAYNGPACSADDQDIAVCGLFIVGPLICSLRRIYEEAPCDEG